MPNRLLLLVLLVAGVFLGRGVGAIVVALTQVNAAEEDADAPLLFVPLGMKVAPARVPLLGYG